ncbi:hypothetical protein NQ318_013766 [Aromia moschata]|uniref:Uncharacterized protein n=1 Tax=Aromia moschata TaxID=1265417 RepID=A0AAV8ZAS5_9CUCU|nr:hypothetical protein NQ318_013766 [Aromia moschata]
MINRVFLNDFAQEQHFVFVNEEGNEVADRAVDVAMTYIKKNSKLGVSVELRKVVGNRTDSNTFLESQFLNFQLILNE